MSERMRIIKKGIRVDYLLNEVLSIPVEEWTVHSKDKKHRVLPLTVPILYDGEKNILDSQDTVNTNHYFKCPKVINWLRRNGFQHHTWAGIYMLPPGGKVPWHTDDEGEYYINKMRYHLCLQGKYRYSVKLKNDELHEEIIEPGTFFWFDIHNPHSAECISEDNRITLLFDLPNTNQLNYP